MILFFFLTKSANLFDMICPCSEPSIRPDMYTTARLHSINTANAEYILVCMMDGVILDVFRDIID